jgi:tetratricopeptide (TPR) repeat protein
MKNTGYEHHKSIISNRASGYVKTLNGYDNEKYRDMSLHYAAGALYSTVEDLYLWDQVLYTEKLLSKKYKDLMFKPNLDNYAYGWDIIKMPITESKDSLKVVSHGGGIAGFSTLISRLVDDKHLIVLLSNAGSIDRRGMSVRIVNILYGKPYNMPKKSIAEALYKKIKEKDIVSTVKYYHELKDMYPDDYDFGKNELHWLGVNLQDAGMLDEAIEIYKLIIEIDPDWWDAYYGIADVYRLKGDKELAIKYYAKSLEMNPEIANHISETLKKLTE